ncbi:MAG TPA: hypothetical protein VFM18_18385 [Methanosarcina sp.]|nr:hypothetical protein [Methanosarcina sp.]
MSTTHNKILTIYRDDTPGPIICPTCQVEAEWYQLGIGPGGWWECPICLEQTEHRAPDRNPETMARLKENYKFLRFSKGNR